MWNEKPCTTIRKDMLGRHEFSAMHKECACRMVKARGGIREAMQEQVVLTRTAVVGAMKCLYWLCKEEMPHTTKYEPLLSLVKCLGCSYLSTAWVTFLIYVLTI